jgi:hypothetical protein
MRERVAMLPPKVEGDAAHRRESRCLVTLDLLSNLLQQESAD